MAHLNIFELSIQFKFKPNPRVWIECEASVNGWIDERCEYVECSVPIGNTGYVSTLKFDPWKTAFRRELDRRLDAAEGLPQGEELQQLFSGFNIPCLVGVKPGSQLGRVIGVEEPEPPGRQLLLKALRATEPPTVQDVAGEKDPWEMREEFFRCRPTAKDFGRFLNRWGSWSVNDDPVTLLELIECQTTYREALTQEPEMWLHQFGFFTLEKIRTPPYMAFRVTECKHAIEATITIDLLNKVPFGICARPDCRMPFVIKSKHSRQYCRTYCAHIVNVRERRRNPNAKKGKP
jgi:hypothetical protein